MNKKYVITLVSLLSLNTMPVAAEQGWFIKPYFGLSEMSDLAADFADIDGLSAQADIGLDSGFTPGLSVGYGYNDRVSLELGWEYRSNDSETVLSDTSEFVAGNYASNIFYLNGKYSFNSMGRWQPYIGGGLTWAQEIDIDLERDGSEMSYSGEGNIGYQVFAGIDFDLFDSWKLQSELRYGSISGNDLEGEGGDPGTFNGIDYETTTLQLGIVYSF